MSKFYQIIFYLLFFVSSINAQLQRSKNDTLTLKLNATSATSLPDIIPPSPNVTALMKYVEYPVSMYTGTIDISIPIYTIDVKGIQVPIEFKYHSSGIKYDDLALEVGLGWSLSAGGIISMTVMGGDDNKLPRFIKKDIDPGGNCKVPYTTDLEYLRDIVKGNGHSVEPAGVGRRDGEFDMYNFSFLQHNGQFFFPDQNSDGTPRNPEAVFIPANPMRVAFEAGEIVLTDEKGITYIFTAFEADYLYQRYMTYYLTKIISVDKADTISFNYTRMLSVDAISRPYIGDKETIVVHYLKGWPKKDLKDVLRVEGLNKIDYNPSVIDNITFRGGKIVFEYNPLSKRDLRTIKIYNDTQTTPVKTVTLDKSKFSNNEDKLDKVSFVSNDDTYNYKLFYDGEPPAYGMGIDFWGYKNSPNKSSNSYVPLFDINVGFSYKIGGRDRASNNDMKGGILNKIVYPTKGYSKFEYQPHQAGGKKYGGLRISEIYTYDENDQFVNKKWYKYGLNESGNGRACCLYPGVKDFCNTTLQISVLNINSSFISAEWHYTYSSFPKKPTSSGSTVVYNYVTEYLGDINNVSNGKTVYHFSDFPENNYFTARMENPDRPFRNTSWKNGKLTYKAIFNKDGTLIYEMSTEFCEINTSEYLNLSVLPYANISGGNNESLFSCYKQTPDSDISSNIGQTFFDYFNYYNTTGLYVPSNTRVSQDGVDSKIHYDDYNKYGMVSKERTSQSSGKDLLVHRKYPNDFVQPDNIYDQMVKKNILDPIVEQDTYVDQVLLSRTKTNYNWFSNMLLPSSLETQEKGQTTPETRIRYHSYDNYGNPAQLSYEKGPDISYLWGYKGQYPIAKIENASYQEVKLALGSTTPEAIASKNAPSESDFNAINNLRKTAPLKDKALVTTYTYKPLIGMTSETDPSGRTIFYEYDGFGRLKQIKDEKKNVLKEHRYNYAK